MKEQVCYWCGEPVTFVTGRGWLHPDGELVRTRVDQDGRERDDHVGYPVQKGTARPESRR